jgi:hypothetical protein
MKTSLEIILENLNLPEEEKAELYKNLRSLDIKDDNDPLLKITLVLSIIAKFTEEIPEKITYERQLLENLLDGHKEISNNLSADISKLIEHTKRKELVSVLKPLPKKCQKLSINRLYIAIIVFLTFLGIVFNYFYSFTPIEKTYFSRMEFLKKCSKTPEIFKVDGRDGWFITIKANSAIKLKNGQTAAQLKGFY